MVRAIIGVPGGSLVLTYKGRPGENPNPRPVCFCAYSFGQFCAVCNPDGIREFAVVRPELGARLIG